MRPWPGRHECEIRCLRGARAVAAALARCHDRHRDAGILIVLVRLPPLEDAGDVAAAAAPTIDTTILTPMPITIARPGSVCSSAPRTPSRRSVAAGSARRFIEGFMLS